MKDALLCDFEGPKYLLFSDNISSVVYYSHLPIILISLLLGIYVYRSAKKGLPNKVLFWTTVAFSLWVILDSIFWASNRSDIIMFVWSTILLVEPLVYIGGFYLVYSLIEKKDLPFYLKTIFAILLLPIIVFLPTEYSLSGFDLTTCLSTEGPIALYYVYAIEILITISLLVYSGIRFFQIKDIKTRNEIFYIVIGVLLLLASFASGNLIGSYTENWDLAQIGLFGMPFFIGFLAYTIVRFRTFNIRVIGANVLVLIMWVLVASTLVVNELRTIRVILGITLVFSGILGVYVIKGIRKEVAHKEKIQKLAFDLQNANKRLVDLDQQKTEFVSFASHQLRSPLTAMKGYASLILEGDYGKLNADMKVAVGRILESSKTLANVVDDYLNISRIELGNMKYNISKIDFREVISSVIDELIPSIEKAGLSFSFVFDKNEKYQVLIDSDKFKQVIGNIIDNSLKYTPKGSISATLTKENGKIRFSVKDTGVGISEKTLPKLFQKFTRADNASATNIHGTGLGLYVAKEIVEAHKGKIWAESEGEGKGSQFYIELNEEK